MINSWHFSARSVALSFVAVSLVVLASFATPLWYTWRETIEEGRVRVLKADARRLVNVFNQQGVAPLQSAIEIQVGTQAAGAEDLVLFADSSLVRLAGNLPAWPHEVSANPGMYTLWIDVDGKSTRVVLLHRALPGGYHLLVANDVAKYRELENLFLYGLICSTGIVLLLGVAGGLLVRRTLLAKVGDINQAASAIMQGNFSHRLPAHGGENEFNTLVETENRMLDQIEQLIDGVRNVSNAIAHDLRTPLAELRSRLEELALTRPDPAHTFNEIDGAISDVDRVINIFNALLRLAEIDTGARRSGFVEVDVSSIAGEVAEFYQPVAELQGRELSFTSSGPLVLTGDPLLIAQAIGNLIDNALKYAQVNGKIAVETSRHLDGAIQVAVSDDGPGISDAEKPKVLERFYRGDTSRGTPGAGLGLSLVAAVAKLQGGAIVLNDNHPGLKVTLMLQPPNAPAA
ncbi:MAG: sensor histidine kinase [Collimonas fungivorans]|uniref:HAMP domain-containing sensor histidine kinase n=1 Tax=Collimonas fungivorans TaxID=158899 RepID=UPI0026F1EC92|nr:HAMP domain-containing sensor histidine kinase [Collimonas fungivorans]MDB5767804.1 sensor histidine kinase [Collimonas fungivorans]